VSSLGPAPRSSQWAACAVAAALLLAACTADSVSAPTTSSPVAVSSTTDSPSIPSGIRGYRVGSVDCHRHNWVYRFSSVTGDIQSYVFCAPRRGNNFNVLVPFEVTSTSPWFPVLTRVLAVPTIKTPKGTGCPLGPYIWYPPVYVRTSDGIWIARLPSGVCGQVRPVVSDALFHMVRTRNVQPLGGAVLRDRPVSAAEPAGFGAKVGVFEHQRHGRAVARTALGVGVAQRAGLARLQRAGTPRSDATVPAGPITPRLSHPPSLAPGPPVGPSRTRLTR
jgi:hypothetical protein